MKAAANWRYRTSGQAQPFINQLIFRAVTTEEWSEANYPSFCPGGYYLASVSVVKRLLDVVHLQRFFWIDDVFITGVLVNAANISVTDMNRLTLSEHDPRARLNGSVAFITGRQYFRHWFFAVNYETLTLN
ncbi:hypothetical protein COOONC_09060 [Cooperia oncophora]